MYWAQIGLKVKIPQSGLVFLTHSLICVDGFLCMSHLDIVHMLSAYVHVIHTLSGHMRIMRTLFAVVLDIFLPNS